MHTRNEPSTKIANDRSFIQLQGVEAEDVAKLHLVAKFRRRRVRQVKQKSPSRAEAAANLELQRHRLGAERADGHARGDPADRAEHTHSGNSLPGSFIWWKESELVSDKVGMKQSV
jgi:hypothetical protein